MSTARRSSMVLNNNGVRRSPRRQRTKTPSLNELSKKCKNSPKGKRRLQFQNKIPLAGKSFYLDLPNYKGTAKLARRLTDLGGKVEEFLSKDVSYLVTSRKDADGRLSPHSNSTPSPGLSVPSPYPATNKSSSTKAWPSPFSADSPQSVELRKATPKEAMRGKTLAHQASMKNKSGSNMLTNAATWGVTIIHVDKVQEKLAQYGPSRHERQDPVTPLKTYGKSQLRVQIKKLQLPFIKVEDKSYQFKPLVHEFKEWPVPNFDSPVGSCPFDSPKTVRELEKAKKSKTKDLKESKKPKKGYCECCRLHYDDLDMHLKSDHHQAFAKDDSNYSTLDALISQGPSLQDFLEKIKKKYNNQSAENSSPVSNNTVDYVYHTPTKLLPHEEDVDEPCGSTSQKPGAASKVMEAEVSLNRPVNDHVKCESSGESDKENVNDKETEDNSVRETRSRQKQSDEISSQDKKGLEAAGSKKPDEGSEAQSMVTLRVTRARSLSSPVIMSHNEKYNAQKLRRQQSNAVAADESHLNSGKTLREEKKSGKAKKATASESDITDSHKSPKEATPPSPKVCQCYRNDGDTEHEVQDQVQQDKARSRAASYLLKRLSESPSPRSEKSSRRKLQRGKSNDENKNSALSSSDKTESIELSAEVQQSQLLKDQKVTSSNDGDDGLSSTDTLSRSKESCTAEDCEADASDDESHQNRVSRNLRPRLEQASSSSLSRPGRQCTKGAAPVEDTPSQEKQGADKRTKTSASKNDKPLHVTPTKTMRKVTFVESSPQSGPSQESCSNEDGDLPDRRSTISSGLYKEHVESSSSGDSDTSIEVEVGDDDASDASGFREEAAKPLGCHEVKEGHGKDDARTLNKAKEDSAILSLFDSDDEDSFEGFEVPHFEQSMSSETELTHCINSIVEEFSSEQDKTIVEEQEKEIPRVNDTEVAISKVEYLDAMDDDVFAANDDDDNDDDDYDDDDDDSSLIADSTSGEYDEPPLTSPLRLVPFHFKRKSEDLSEEVRSPRKRRRTTTDEEYQHSVSSISESSKNETSEELSGSDKEWSGDKNYRHTRSRVVIETRPAGENVRRSRSRSANSAVKGGDSYDGRRKTVEPVEEVPNETADNSMRKRSTRSGESTEKEAINKVKCRRSGASGQKNEVPNKISNDSVRKRSKRSGESAKTEAINKLISAISVELKQIEAAEEVTHETTKHRSRSTRSGGSVKNEAIKLRKTRSVPKQATNQVSRKTSRRGEAEGKEAPHDSEDDNQKTPVPVRRESTKRKYSECDEGSSPRTTRSCKRSRGGEGSGSSSDNQDDAGDSPIKTRSRKSDVESKNTISTRKINKNCSESSKESSSSDQEVNLIKAKPNALLSSKQSGKKREEKETKTKTPAVTSRQAYKNEEEKKESCSEASSTPQSKTNSELDNLVIDGSFFDSDMTPELLMSLGVYMTIEERVKIRSRKKVDETTVVVADESMSRAARQAMRSRSGESREGTPVKVPTRTRSSATSQSEDMSDKREGSTLPPLPRVVRAMSRRCRASSVSSTSSGIDQTSRRARNASRAHAEETLPPKGTPRKTNRSRASSVSSTPSAMDQATSRTTKSTSRVDAEGTAPKCTPSKTARRRAVSVSSTSSSIEQTTSRKTRSTSRVDAEEATPPKRTPRKRGQPELSVDDSTPVSKSNTEASPLRGRLCKRTERSPCSSSASKSKWIFDSGKFSSSTPQNIKSRPITSRLHRSTSARDKVSPRTMRNTNYCLQPGDSFEFSTEDAYAFFD